MTSQKEQIQFFIAEIDSVLQKTNPRLPWVMSGEVLQQRQMLERVRNFFVDLLHQLPSDSSVGFDHSAASGEQALPGEEQSDLTPYQMMQTILRDVSYLRANMAPPQASQQQLTTELLQVLMSRLQENLSQQIAQTLENLRNQSSAAGGNPMLAPGTGSSPGLTRPSQYDQLQSLRSRSDQMLVNLDSTLNIVFESLQRNIEAYQESLKQGVEQMYSLGQQSEVMFKALVDQIAQQLKQEASSYLLSSAQTSTATPEAPSLTPVDRSSGTPSTRATTQRPSTTEAATTPAQPAAQPNFPYAGVELSPSASASPSPSSASEHQNIPLESAIESWLKSVRSMDDAPTISVDASSQPDLDDLDLPNLDLSDLNLVDISQVEIKQADTADSGSEPVPALDEPVLSEVDGLEASQASSAQSIQLDIDNEDAEDTADIDAALKLLEDLTAELDDSATATSLEDAEAQLKQMLNSVSIDEELPAIEEISEFVAMPEDARDELDEFYQSLFGEMEETSDATTTVAEPPVTSEPIELEAITPEVVDVTPETEVIPEASQSNRSDTVTSSVSDSSLAAEGDSLGNLFPDLDDSVEDVIETDLGIFDILGEDTEAAESSETAVDAPIILDLPDDLFEDIAEPEPLITATEPKAVLDVSEPDEVELLTDLFETVQDAETRSTPVEPPAIELPSAITASQPSVEPESFFLGDDLFGSQSALDLTDDQYTRAAPDENLLPDAPVEQVDLNLDLDDFTLSSLSEDLSTLEDLVKEGDRAPVPERPVIDDVTLDDFAGDLLQSPVVQTPIAQPTQSFDFSASESFTLDQPAATSASSSEESFSLEVFAETISDASASSSPLPSVSPVSPAAPPTSPFYQASPEINNITVEGFSDLFDDAPPISNHPTVSPNPNVAPTESLPFTLESTHYSLETDLSGAFPPPPATNSPFTLEGMDDLFDDAAPIAPNTPQSLYNPHTQSMSVKGDALSLNGADRSETISSLFEDGSKQEQSENFDRASVPPSQDTFTLDSPELFGDAPSPDAVVSSAAVSSEPDASPASPEPLPFTLEGMDDLFEDAPPIQATQRPASPPKEIPPFKPELFNNGGETTENLPPFQLERLDNLFADVSAPSIDPSQNASSTGAQPPLPDKESLDAAFESLFGSSVESPHSAEKKKEADVSPPSTSQNQFKTWYLGIDVGAIALSATLFNLTTGERHPIHWSSAHPQLNLVQSYELSVTDYLAAEFAQGRTETHPNFLDPDHPDEEDSMQWLYFMALLRRFKPYLNTIVPFFSPHTQQWEPQIQVFDTEEVAFVAVRQCLSEVLKSLTSHSLVSVTCGADGLTPEALHNALGQLAGVVVNHPVGASDAYQFNVREAILATGLVRDAARIYFIEEAIAALLDELYRGHSLTPNSPVLVVSAGTSITELVLVNLPADPLALSRNDLYLRRLAYAGNALDQDIICQLLHPIARGWESLELETLDLPLPGEADLEARFRLQQRLESLPLGQTLLKIVRQMKPLLCQHNLFFKVGNTQWKLSQQDLYQWVIVPYLQQLNREITLLLTQAGMSGSDIKTVACTGGTMTIPAIADWLEQKFSDARVIRDTIADQGKTSYQRVANGLAVLPKFPAVLDAIRHQYNEYFLLREVLKTLPVSSDRAYSSTHLQTLLEAKGIPAQACEQFVKNLVEGQLPTGLTVTKASAVLLSPNSTQQVDYQALMTAPLFTRQEQVYRLNLAQRDRVWNHLQIILAKAYQTLENALSIELELTSSRLSNN